MALRIAWRLANVYNLPGAIAAGILGFGILHPLGWGFKPGWVQASIAIWLLMLLNGLFYLRPALKKMLAAAEASVAAGAPTAGVHPARRRQGSAHRRRRQRARHRRPHPADDRQAVLAAIVPVRGRAPAWPLQPAPAPRSSRRANRRAPDTS